MGRKDQSAQPSDLAMIKEAIVKLGSDIDDLKAQIEKLKKQNSKEYDDKLNAYKGHSSNYLHAYIPSDVNLKNKIVKIKFTKKNKLDF